MQPSHVLLKEIFVIWRGRDISGHNKWTLHIFGLSTPVVDVRTTVKWDAKKKKKLIFQLGYHPHIHDVFFCFFPHKFRFKEYNFNFFPWIGLAYLGFKSFYYEFFVSKFQLEEKIELFSTFLWVKNKTKKTPKNNRIIILFYFYFKIKKYFVSFLVFGITVY